MTQPNFLIVLFDALRASDWPGGSEGVTGLRFAEKLQRESIIFPSAASVAPWTIPAHASLFTGLYPWEHGAHGRTDLTLPTTVPRLPDMLRKSGYASLCLSANTLICPRFGLVEGFDDSGWGGWWESYVRQVRSDSPPAVPGQAHAEARLLDRFRDGAGGQFVLRNTERFYRYPFLFDSVDRVHQRLRRPGVPRDISVAPWLEPSLARWLQKQPSDRPVFCFLNLVDTHEPYFAAAGTTHGFRDWWSYARVRQDFVRALTGQWVPSSEELRVLRTMYRQTVLNLDHRLEAFVQAFQDVGRWDNTVLVVTSDHGQAFGEHGQLFHLNGVIDPLLRIPLWYRPVGGGGGGKRAEGWASLIDVAPTLLADAGDYSGSFPSATSLHALVDQPRPEPLLAMSEGLVWRHLKEIVPSARQSEFNKVTVVAYAGEKKLTLDTGSGATALYDLKSDPGESRNLWPSDDPSIREARTAAEVVGRRMNTLPEVELSKDVEERLRAWGYI